MHGSENVVWRRHLEGRRYGAWSRHGTDGERKMKVKLIGEEPLAKRLREGVELAGNGTHEAASWAVDAEIKVGSED